MDNVFSNAFFSNLMEVFSSSEESLIKVLENFDDKGLLHCLTGPAVECDNFGAWAIHGEIYSNLDRYVEDAGLTEEEAVMLSLRFSGVLPSSESKKYVTGR